MDDADSKKKKKTGMLALMSLAFLLVMSFLYIWATSLLSIVVSATPTRRRWDQHVDYEVRHSGMRSSCPILYAEQPMT